MEGDLQRTLGANLRAYRQARNLSQEAFADACGLHRTYVGALERGERNLTLRTLERMAELLDVDPLDLLVPPVPATTRTAPGRRLATESA